MTALSILEMNRTLVAREYAMDEHLKTLPKNLEPVYYWQVQRKSKVSRRGNIWITVSHLYCTKADAAKAWVKDHRGKPDHRLKCVLKYPSVR
jgi:hypothetical protein